MQKLDPALKCDESDTVYWAIPEEVHDKPPIHRSECGAFLCMLSSRYRLRTGLQLWPRSGSAVCSSGGECYRKVCPDEWQMHCRPLASIPGRKLNPLTESGILPEQ